jgi:hypothetical protein
MKRLHRRRMPGRGLELTFKGERHRGSPNFIKINSRDVSTIS